VLVESVERLTLRTTKSEKVNIKKIENIYERKIFVMKQIYFLYQRRKILINFLKIYRELMKEGVHINCSDKKAVEIIPWMV
jgi:hypothetical protein